MVWNWFFDQAPKLSGITAIIYIAIFVGSYLDPSIAQYEDAARFWLFVGVILFLPFIFIDLLVTHSFETGEVAWVGLVNTIALGIAYYKANVSEASASIKTAIIIFAIIIVLSIAVKVKQSRKTQQR